MRHGLSLFPVLAPEERSAEQYFAESLELVELAESLEYDHVQIVEHYLGPYGGYSPDPTTFLAAAAMRTKRIRLITGASIPAFTHPLQLAGKLSMLDNLSGGRMGVGMGRAFLPGEFDVFGVDIDESRQRFVAGVEACRRLWSETEVTIDDGFHRMGPITSLPRPVQRPHPPIYLASAMSPETCAWAGEQGFGLQVVPTITSAERLRAMLDAYREAWIAAGRQVRDAQIQLKFTCYLDEDPARALVTAERLERNYIAKMTSVVRSWAGRDTAAYPGYEALADKVSQYDFASAHRDDKVLAGTPDDVVEQLTRVRDRLGEFDVSCVFSPGDLSADRAAAAMRMFAEHVVPQFAQTAVTAR